MRDLYALLVNKVPNFYVSVLSQDILNVIANYLEWEKEWRKSESED